MSKKPEIKVDQPSQIQGAAQWLTRTLQTGLQSGAVIVTLSRPNRTGEQNRLLWHILGDIAHQCTWPTTGGRQMAPEHWKTLFMSAYRQEVGSVVMGINQEPVNLALSTSKLNKAEFSELVELIYASGSQWGVQWTDRALQAYEEAIQ